ncbi:MAG: S49 family peptidase [Pseudomonadota bacterium]
MTLLDLLHAPWAILPERLELIHAIYQARLAGEPLDRPAIEAQLGRQLGSVQPAYEVIDGVAVLPIQGVLAPKANMFTDISGGASAQMLAREVQRAAAEPAVRALVLSVDSPGGAVHGIPELGAAVSAANRIKPVVTLSDAQIASAAYWVGSAAREVFVTGPTVQVGSIGVVIAHRDTSRAQEMRGVRVTEITAGRFKRIASENGPLTPEGRATLEEQAGHLYDLFVETVAANRGVSTDTVLADMADGRIFFGRQAVDAGLVDGMTSLDELIARLARDTSRITPSSRRAAASSVAPHVAVIQAAQGATMPPDQSDQTTTQATATAVAQAVASLTPEALEQSNPQLAATLRQQGAAAERQRITDVRAQVLPGHEALIERLAFDGTTTGAQAAMAVLAAERQSLSAAAAAHASDAPPAANHAAAPADEGTELTKEQQAAKAKAHAKAKGIDFVAAMKDLGFAS